MKLLQLWRLYRAWHHWTKGGTMFDGYKTYLCALGIGLATAAKVLGWIDEATYQTIVALLGAGGLAALRAGVNKG